MGAGSGVVAWRLAFTKVLELCFVVVVGFASKQEHALETFSIGLRDQYKDFGGKREKAYHWLT